MNWFIHIVTVLLSIGTVIWIFPINWALAIVPIFLYLFILQKNTFLLVYKKLVESKLGGVELALDQDSLNLFHGRETFVHAVIQVLIAIAFSSIFNLLVAIWVSYVSIVKCGYLKYK